MLNKILKKNLSGMPVLTLTLIFMGMFSLISVFELVQPALGPVLTPGGSRFLTVIIAGASAAFIAFFPLRALRDTEVKFRAIYEDSHDAILILNETGLLDCNRQALHMFGISSVEEMRTCSPAALSPPVQPDGQASPATLQDHIQAAFHDGYVHFEWIYLRKNGETFPTDVLLSSFYQGNELVLQATIRDVSDQKRIEAALRESNECFLTYIRETALRLKIPVEVVHENIAVIIADIENGDADRKNLLLQLHLQEKNLAQIRLNVRDLNQRIFDHKGDIPSVSNDLLTT
jgi:PAS domain S-box-containing protein